MAVPYTSLANAGNAGVRPPWDLDLLPAVSWSTVFPGGGVEGGWWQHPMASC